MLIYSHRGVPDDLCPENSLLAFERARLAGVDGIETDVRLTRDHVPVLFHDPLTPSGVPLTNLTHRELVDDVGYEVPTLKSALEVPWTRLRWNIELKTKAAVEPALAIIKKHMRERHIFVSSVSYGAVEKFIRYPDLTCGLVLRDRDDVFNIVFRRPGSLAAVDILVWNFTALDPELLVRADRQGYRHYVYGMTTVEEHRLCMELGADAVITDFPERAFEATGRVRGVDSDAPVGDDLAEPRLGVAL